MLVNQYLYAMKLIYTILLSFGLAICLAEGHNTQIATFTMRDTGAGWLMAMNLAQAGVDAALIEKHGKQKINGLDRKAYQNLVVDYVKANFKLNVDGKDIKLGSGSIVLGSHQTDLKFVLPDVPIHPQEAHVNIPMFSTSDNHTNLFRVYRGGKKIAKLFLSENNDFKVDLIFTSQGIIAKEKKEKNDHFLMMSGGSLMLGLVLVIALSRRKMKV